MVNIEIDNCNNIVHASINLEEAYLNIFYAVNGTGKTTIGKAIEQSIRGESLSFFKPFGSDIDPSIRIPETIRKVLVFNEDFVNTIVFKESEVIENAFDVFIKTPEYETKNQSVNERLGKLRIDINSNQEISQLLSIGRVVLSKFTLTVSKEFKQTGFIKSLTNPNNIFQLPDQLQKYKPLMEKEYNVDWVGWKNDGFKFDDNNICPFCTNDLREDYAGEKVAFSSAYSKSNVKNIKEMLSYFDSVADYLDEEKKAILYKCIKETTDEQTINLWVKRFYDDLSFLVSKIQKVLDFNTFQIKKEEIQKLGEQLTDLKIDMSNLIIFNNKKVVDIIEKINQQIDLVLKETNELKSEIGQLKGIIGSATEKAISDINEFLELSDINYSLEINQISEDTSKTILRYKSTNQGAIQVENIKIHLSWGERNSFALVLFMHYALSQKPDLIILDDPISSFDSNKKFAIINRLFSTDQRKKSLYKKNVILLTHDFQPIIDFIVNKKPNGQNVRAIFLKNRDGLIQETEITKDDIKSLPILLAENAKNESLNIIHRITCLRKLLEHSQRDHSQEMAYNLLSCLLHCKESATYFDGAEISEADIILGENRIKEFFPDFSFSSYTSSIFRMSNLVNLFQSETKPYYRLQVFRVMIGNIGIRSKIDDALIKYIDEQFHIENDYIYYLDLNKFDIVPNFVIPRCTEYLKKEGIC